MTHDYPYPLLTGKDLRTMCDQAHITAPQIAALLSYENRSVRRLFRGDYPLMDDAALLFLHLYMTTIARMESPDEARAA
jgi:hypothetical protein